MSLKFIYQKFIFNLPQSALLLIILYKCSPFFFSSLRAAYRSKRIMKNGVLRLVSILWNEKRRSALAFVLYPATDSVTKVLLSFFVLLYEKGKIYFLSFSLVSPPYSVLCAGCKNYLLMSFHQLIKLSTLSQFAVCSLKYRRAFEIVVILMTVA